MAWEGIPSILDVINWGSIPANLARTITNKSFPKERGQRLRITSLTEGIQLQCIYVDGTNGNIHVLYATYFSSVLDRSIWNTEVQRMHMETVFHMIVFWDAVRYRLVEGDCSFRGSYCLGNISHEVPDYCATQQKTVILLFQHGLQLPI
jgi:hypothetical protein